MAYSTLEGIVGTPQPRDIFIPDTTQRFPLGTVINAVDPVFGFGEFIYGQCGATPIGVGRLSYFASNTYIASDVPNTANLGRALMVSAAAMAANTYGFFQISGLAPWSCTASVAAGTSFGITAAGQVGANAAGKQILNAQVVQPSTYAPTKTVQTVTGSPVVSMGDVSGLFVGLPISGAGIPGGTTISAINPNQNQITMSANATATGSVTGTFTHTGFLLVYFQRAFAQGAIT